MTSRESGPANVTIPYGGEGRPIQHVVAEALGAPGRDLVQFLKIEGNAGIHVPISVSVPFSFEIKRDHKGKKVMTAPDLHAAKPTVDSGFKN